MARSHMVHIARAAPPWARQPHSECGKLFSDGRRLLTHKEFFEKIHDEGKITASMSTCMTCWGKVVDDFVGLRRYGSWKENPAGVLGRYLGISTNFVTPKTQEMSDDLHALAELVARHREEFDQLRAVSDLEAARRAKQEQEAKEARQRRLTGSWRRHTSTD
jgi:hypothetical protein